MITLPPDKMQTCYDITSKENERRLATAKVSADGSPTGFSFMRRCGQGATGLGLAIVKSICDYHGWTVAYRFESGWHRFCVSFA